MATILHFESQGVDVFLVMSGSANARIVPVLVDAINAKTLDVAEHVLANLHHLGLEIHGAIRIPTGIMDRPIFERVELFQGVSNIWHP